MFISHLISEFEAYRQTTDYVHGVLVEMTGILVEVLLLSITIPVILWSIRRLRTRRIRATVDFYLFQVFHKVTRMFLRMASIRDIAPILSAEQKQNPKFKIYSHFVYGNLENILFVLERTFATGDGFREEVEKRSLAEFREFRDVADRCIDEMDRLAAMLVGVPHLQREIFDMRILVYPLRDICAEVIEDIVQSDKEPFRRSFYSYDVYREAVQLTTVIGELFAKRRKLIDSMLKYDRWRSDTRMILSLPYVVARRWATIRLCRMRGKPYRDFILQSPIPEMLRDWRHRRGLSLGQAANVLGIPERDVFDYEQGYCDPPLATIAAMRPHLRETYGSNGEKPQTEQHVGQVSSEAATSVHPGEQSA